MGEIQPSSAPLTGAPKGDVRASEPGQLGSGPEADRSFEPRREGTGSEERRRRALVRTRKAQSDWVVAPQRIFLGDLYIYIYIY